MTDIYLPGFGRVPFNIVSAQNAVSEYDPDLMLGRNEHTGEWQALIKNGPHGGQPFPVFTFGLELPDYEGIKRKLYLSDVRKRGHQIVLDIQNRNDARKAERDRVAADAAGEVAEFMEHEFRKSGEHPSPRIFVPSGKE